VSAGFRRGAAGFHGGVTRRAPPTLHGAMDTTFIEIVGVFLLLGVARLWLGGIGRLWEIADEWAHSPARGRALPL
jgi:hypothetical protein